MPIDAPAHTVARARVATWRRVLAAAWSARLALLPVLVFLPMLAAPPINHDVAAVLSFSQRWYAGERLYVDLIDVNPPLIFVLNLVPAALADLTGLDGVVALQIVLFAFGFAMWALALRVRDRAAEPPILRGLLDVLPGLMVFACGYDFGQRETLMVACATPYLLVAARREVGEVPRARIAAAVLAAVGFALKPYFLGIPALVELVVLLGRAHHGNDWRAAIRDSLSDPVPWTLAAVWVAYLVGIKLLFPEFLGVVVPLVWDFYLDQGGLSALQVLLVPRLATALCLLVPLLLLTLRQRRRPTAALARMSAAAAIGALASAMVQHKGWTYHVVPVELMALALATVLAARWLDAGGAERLPGGARAATALLACVFALYCVEAGEAPWNEIGYDRSDAAHLTDLLRAEAADERVLVLSPGIAPIYPALNYSHGHMTLRTMNMWLLEGAYQTCLPDGKRYREVWEMGRPEFFVYRTVAEDFARAPPAAVVVDRNPGIPWCGEEFDFIAYFSRHQLFAEVWSHYQPAGEWGRYRVFTRKD
jgi:hypothetical protein